MWHQILLRAALASARIQRERALPGRGDRDRHAHRRLRRARLGEAVSTGPRRVPRSLGHTSAVPRWAVATGALPPAEQCDYHASMYDPAMQLETSRLILRQPRLSELEAWADFMADPKTANHVGGVQPRPVVWRSLAMMVGSWALLGFGMFSVL